MTQRSINLIAAALVVVGGAALAIWATRPLAPDDDAPAHTAGTHEPLVHPAPFELYGRAQLGDWSAYRVDNGLPSGHVHTTVVRAIGAAEPDHVTRTDRGRADGASDAPTEHAEDYPRAGLSLERLTGLDHAGWTITDETVALEPHTVGDRTFRATKISFASADPLFPRKRTRTELWLSDAVPAGGVVAEREVQELDGTQLVFTEELVGFGDANGATWGERPAGL